MKKSVFSGIAMLLCSLFVVVSANAESINSLYVFGETNLVSDLSFEKLINAPGSPPGDTTLDQNDRLRGIFRIDTLHTTSGYSIYAPDYACPYCWNEELVALFDITVQTKFAPGDIGNPYPGQFFWIFAPTPGFGTVVGTMIQVFEDPANNYDVSLATTALVEATVIDGTAYWEIGFLGEPGEGWIASAPVDDITQLTSFIGVNTGIVNFALNLTALGPAGVRLLRNQLSVIDGVTNVDFVGNGNFASPWYPLPAYAVENDVNAFFTPARGPIISFRELYYRDYLEIIRICIVWPSGVGIGVPGRCPPPGCPDCKPFFSEDAVREKIPEYLFDIYREVSPFLVSQSHRRIPNDSINRIKTLFMKAPLGTHYTEKLKASLEEEFGRSKEDALRLYGMLAQAVNAMELDLSVPSIPAVKVKAGKYSAVDFRGVAWVAFRNLKKSGKATVKIKGGLPKFVSGFISGWPIASYNFSFTGSLAKNGYADISFYVGGINFAGKFSELRILEWDGKSYRDITIGVDVRRRVITGRTNKLASYVIVTPRHNEVVRRTRR
jgi:hypothetical protein